MSKRIQAFKAGVEVLASLAADAFARGDTVASKRLETQAARLERVADYLQRAYGSV